MQVNYIDFNSNLFKKAVSKTPAIYVSDNERTENLQLARKEYRTKKEPLVKESKFYSWQKLKEILFSCEKIIIREEKQSVALYEILNKEEKQELGIDNYNDIIDFSARFHDFYLGLNEYQIKELPLLQGWQKKRFKILKQIRDRYMKFLSERGLTDPSLVRNESNFNPAGIKDYNKLILLNTVNLTPLERKIIFELDQHINVELYLQLPSQDFSEGELQFKGLSLPDSWPGEINLYTAEEEMLQLASALSLSDEKESLLLSPGLDKTNYSRIIPAGKLKMPREQKFNRTAIFKFIRSLYRLLRSSPPGSGEIGLPELLNAVSHICFRRYFNLSLHTLNAIRELIQDNYLYLTPEMAVDKIPELKTLLTELDNLRNISDLSELISYMDNLNLNKLKDSNWNNDLEQFYDGLMELSALEEMELVSSWGDYYEVPYVGLIDRLLQYLEYKQVQPLLPEEESDLELKSLYAAPHSSQKHLLILNARQGWLIDDKGDFLLTENQRREVGLPTNRDNRKYQRYYFLRHLLSSDRAEVLSLENKEENESPGAFMEELKLKYDLEFNEAPVARNHYVNLYRSIFRSDSKDQDIISPLTTCNNSELSEEEDPVDEPIIEKDDFSRDRFYLSYYKFSTMDQCYFRFLCERLMKLEREMGSVEKELTPLTFGNIVHSFAEIMLKNITVSELILSREDINKFIGETLESFHTKIDHRFQNYYKQIVRKELVNSMVEFFQELQDIFVYLDFQPQKMKVEYTPHSTTEDPFYYSQLIDYYLSGRIDLFIEGTDSDMVIDFKSGGMNEDQLNFYALLLKQNQKEDKPVHKYMYQVIEQNFQYVEPGAENEFRSEIKEVLEEFSGSDRYIKTPYRCNRCPYQNICRVVS